MISISSKSHRLVINIQLIKTYIKQSARIYLSVIIDQYMAVLEERNGKFQWRFEKGLKIRRINYYLPLSQHFQSIFGT